MSNVIRRSGPRLPLVLLLGCSFLASLGFLWVSAHNYPGGTALHSLNRQLCRPATHAHNTSRGWRMRGASASIAI